LRTGRDRHRVALQTFRPYHRRCRTCGNCEGCGYACAAPYNPGVEAGVVARRCLEFVPLKSSGQAVARAERAEVGRRAYFLGKDLERIIGWLVSVVETHQARLGKYVVLGVGAVVVTVEIPAYRAHVARCGP